MSSHVMFAALAYLHKQWLWNLGDEPSRIYAMELDCPKSSMIEKWMSHDHEQTTRDNMKHGLKL